MGHEKACPKRGRYARVAAPIGSATFTLVHPTPLCSVQVYHHHYRARVMSSDEFAPLDPQFVRERLSKPPFVSIPGVDNVRDLGSYPTEYPGMMTKPHVLYRAAEISHITDEGTKFTQCFLEVSWSAVESGFVVVARPLRKRGVVHGLG